MSYSGALGQLTLAVSPQLAMTLRSLAPAAQITGRISIPPSAAPTPETDPFFPATCAHLKRYVSPPALIPANTIVVKAWPFTKASITQVNKMLDYLTKPVRGPQEPAAARRLRAFPEAINRAWMNGLLYSGSGSARKSTPGTLMRVFSAGFIPDPESSRTVTRGTFWIALSMGTAMYKGWFDLQLRRFKRQAMEYAGIASPLEQNQLMVNMSGVALADGGYGVTPEQLKEGAYKSALSSGEFAAFVRTTFAMPRIAKSSSQIAQPIEAQARKVVDGVAALSQIDNVVSGVGAEIGKARAMPDAAQAVQVVIALRQAVEGIKATINNGVVAASVVLRLGQQIRTDILGQMRRAILQSAEASILRGIGFSIARDYVRCWTLLQARRTLGRQMDSLLAKLMAGVNAARQLTESPTAVQRANKTLDKLIDRLKKEERELPLSLWQRTTLGIPHWGWAGVGVVAVLGGAVGLRRLRKKRKPRKNRPSVRRVSV